MPARYISERYVGRDDAFGRLAARLDDAAHGRARTVLVSGTAGVGISRFLDEATARMGSLGAPMTILRAAAWPDGADEPYGPIVRSVGPVLRQLPSDVLAARLGSAASEVVRLLPDLGDRLSELEGWTPDRSITAPERRQARVMEGILGLLGRIGDEHPVLLIIEDLHRADAATRALITFLARISREQRLAIVGTFQPDVSGRDDPWLVDLVAMESGPRPPDRVAIEPLDRDELAALIEGIQGERASASLLLLVAERSGGLPLVVEELLAARRELPNVSLTGSFDELVVERMAIRSAGMPAGGADPGAWPGGRCRRTGWRPSPRPSKRARAGSAPRSVSRPRQGDGVLDADLRAGLDEAIDAGFVVDADGTLTFRHESIGRALARDFLPIDANALPRRARHEPRGSSGRDRLALDGAHRSPARRARPRSTRRASRGERHAAGGRAGGARARAVSARRAPARTGASRRRTAPTVGSWSISQVRASEAAFAVGRTSRATSLPRGCDRGRSTRAGIGSDSASCTPGWPDPPGGGGPGGRDAGRPARGRARAARAQPGTGDRSWPRWPS